MSSVEGDDGRFLLYELYDDAEAFEAHKRAPPFAVWRQVADRVLASQVNTRGALLAYLADEARS